MKPVRLPLPYWRLMMLAALVLLTAAMGGAGTARLSAVAGGGCTVRGATGPDRDCDSRLTAPVQTALWQGFYRIDGKATPTTGGGADPLLPDADGLSLAFAGARALPAASVAHPDSPGGPTGRPRGPPVSA